LKKQWRCLFKTKPHFLLGWPKWSALAPNALAIERDMTAILRVLSEHSQLLERLPEAVRDKIGFRGQP
jgi:hypothetical protein